MPILSNQSLLNNQLASDWMHRGMDLAAQNSSGTLEQAIRCFDEAIALRQTLPLSEEAFFRYGLSAGWINRGDAMARLGGSTWLNGAIKSYDEALLLLETLPLEENSLYPRRLAITWINRGNALRMRETINDRWEALECFLQAIRVLDSSDATGVGDRPTLLAGAWINLAGATMDSDGENAEEVRFAVRQALSFIQHSEKIDLPEAGLALKARQILCRAAARDILKRKVLPKAVMQEALDAVIESMALARHWGTRASEEMVLLTRDIFRLGCRIHENGQPYLLADFLMESLAPTKGAPAISLNQEMIDSAHAAIWAAFEKLQVEGFEKIGTPQLDPLLSDLQELRKVEEWLKQLRVPEAATS